MTTPTVGRMLLVPRYGRSSLSDVVPSILAGLRVPGFEDRLGLALDGVSRVALLLVDGLGSEQLRAHPQNAPFLDRFIGGTDDHELTAGFPTTTAVSLCSVGTGLPPGEHGILGYQVEASIDLGLMNSLQWSLRNTKSDALPLGLEPEVFQPRATAFERAVDAGITVAHVGPSMQNGSGLTRAGLRGPQFRTAVNAGDLVARTIDSLKSADRTLVYSYYGDLDLVGHVRGPRSPAWRFELERVDAVIRQIAESLPPDAALVVTSDHGMVQLGERVDFDAVPELRDGVRQLGGEPRARYLYVEAGQAGAVGQRWWEILGDAFRVVTRDDAIEAGWFGPTVNAEARHRIGDVIVVADSTAAVIRSKVESKASALLGHHGSLTSAEMLVPAVVVRGM